MTQTKAKLWKQLKKLAQPNKPISKWKDPKDQLREELTQPKAEIWAKLKKLAGINDPINEWSATKEEIEDELFLLQNTIEEEDKKNIDDFRKQADKIDAKNKTDLIRKFFRWQRSGFKGTLTIDTQKYPLSIINEAYRTAIGNSKVRIRVGELVFTFNEGFINRINEKTEENQEYIKDSSTEIITAVAEIDEVEFLPPFEGKERPNGAFFPYTSNHNYPLINQQIANNKKDVAEINKENCLIYALIKAGVPKKSINSIKGMVTTRNIPQKDIKIIAEVIKKTIQVKYISGNGEVKIKKYGKYDDVIKIGLLENHYFLDEILNITLSAFKKNLPLGNWNIDSTGRRRKNKTFSAFSAVRILIDEKFISPLSADNDLFASTFSAGIDEFTELEYSEDETRKIKPKTTKNERCKNIVFFDFETLPQETHKPIMCYYIDNEGDKAKGFTGDNCGRDMLDNLLSNYSGEVTMYAHNAGYDYKFLLRYLILQKHLRQGMSGLLTCVGIYKKGDKSIKITIKDTYKIISKPLKSFGKCFGLKQGKEIMPYSMLRKDIITKKWIEVSELDEFREFDEDFKKSFLENVEKWGLFFTDDDKKYVDIVGYCGKYCAIDCETLRDGFNIFNEWMEEVTNLSAS